ncbi:hypothetical protein BRD16_05910 [Halobacteriales archaeon SW_6_65_46]|nr:MAG: hypothetical protein BRD16_05910 [Halobacteriales archaeon SW_6_65_46]
MSDQEADSYRTVETAATAAFEVRGSEFIGHVRPVERVAAAERFIDDVRGEYEDATHNVPAYRVRADPFREYSSDDGEPSGSAGKPALNVLEGQELENVVVVVTRYYGGTNLGVGGLVSAYGEAVARSVERAGVVEREPHEQFAATVGYDDSGTVRAVLDSAGVSYEARYEETVTFSVEVPVTDARALRDRLRSATSGRVSIERR